MATIVTPSPSRLTQAGGGRAHRGPDVARLRDRSVQHPLAAELLHQTLGDAEHPAPGVVLLEAGDGGAAGDVLAHEDDVGVTSHLLAQGLVDGLPEGGGTSGDSHDFDPPGQRYET
jgi:hypothetical protein